MHLIKFQKSSTWVPTKRKGWACGKLVDKTNSECYTIKVLDIIRKLKKSLGECDNKAVCEIRKMASEIASLFPVCVQLAKTEEGRIRELEKARAEMIEAVNQTIDGLKRFSSVEDANAWGDLVQQSIEVMTAKINANKSIKEYVCKREDCERAIVELEERLEEKNQI